MNLNGNTFHLTVSNDGIWQKLLPGRAESDMPRYEYKLWTDVEPDYVDTFMNGIAKDGWEFLEWAKPTPYGGLKLFTRREKPDTVKRLRDAFRLEQVAAEARQQAAIENRQEEEKLSDLHNNPLYKAIKRCIDSHKSLDGEIFIGCTWPHIDGYPCNALDKLYNFSCIEDEDELEEATKELIWAEQYLTCTLGSKDCSGVASMFKKIKEYFGEE